MKLVIDISEKDYEKLKDGHIPFSILDVMQNGKPLDTVLDEISAEIEEQYDRVHPYNISCAEGLEMALEIIDKHRAESEGEDA